jgi:hypothetical protein
MGIGVIFLFELTLIFLVFKKIKKKIKIKKEKREKKGKVKGQVAKLFI